MDNQEKYDSIIQKVRIEIARLNKMYVNLENRKFSQGINNYKHKGGDSGQFYIKLFKYIDKINNNFDKYNNITKISKDDYPNMAAYITLDEESKKINPKQIGSQIKAVLKDLQSVLSYEQYSQMIIESNNIKDITKLAWYINKYTTEKNIDLAKYGTLNKFLTIKKLNQNLNPVELLEEERNLIEKIRFALSYDKTEYEVAFLSDFEEYFEKYLKYGLTSQDWAWTKKGFKKFRNLYAKYSVIDRIKEIEEDFVEIDKYYDINDQRNSIFVDNILDGEKTAVKIKKPGVRTSKEIIKDSKEVIIVIAGGYHSNELADVLSQKMINDMVITPNITGNIEKANDKYKRTIKEQAIMESQALAFRLASCSDDITQQKLLLKAGIEALKKNNGTVTAEEIESIIKFVKNEDENVDIKYENGVIELNGNKIPIEKIAAPLNEGLESFSFLYWNAVIEAAITPFKESVKDLSFDKFEGFYKHNINKILFPIVTSISESDGFLSFEAEQVFETFKELYKEGFVIDDETYSLEEFAKLPVETQSKFVQKEFLDIKKHDTVALESIISEPVIRYCNGYGIKLSDKQKDVLERKTEEIVKYILENKQIKKEYLDEEYETTDGKTIKMLDILLGYYNSRFMWTRRKYGLDNFEIKKQLAKYKTEHFIEEYIDKFGEISNAEEKILRQALSKMFTHNEIFGVEYAVKPFNLSVDSINRDMLSFAVENNINDFAAYQLIFVKGLKIENDQQKTKLLKLIAEVNNKFVDTNLAIENDGLAIKIILKDERINEDNMFREYIKLSKNSRNIRSIMTEEDFDYMMRLLDSDDKEAFNNFNSIFEEYISKISEVGKNSVVADENTEVFIYTGYDDIGKNIFDEEVVATVFRKLGIEIDTGIWAKNKLGVNVFGGEENPRYKKFADDKNSDAYWNLFVESLTKFIEDNEYKIKNKEIKILVYIDTHGNVDNISLFNRFPSREYNEVKFIEDVGKVINLIPEGSSSIIDSCHSGEFALNILRSFPEIKSNMITSTSPQHDVGYFIVDGFLLKTFTGDTDTTKPWFSNLLYTVDKYIDYYKKENFTMFDNSIAEPKGVLHTGFITGPEVKKINKEISAKLHNLVNLYRNKDKYDDKQFNDEVEKIQQKTELYKNDEDNFLKVEREQEDLPDYGKNRYYARHRPNVAELSIRENDETAPFWEEFVFGMFVTGLLAIFMISNPFGWFTTVIIAAGLFIGARLGFIDAHRIYKNRKYNKDIGFTENMKARLFPTTILSIPYAIVLFSGFGTFLPALQVATGVAMLFHYFWNKEYPQKQINSKGEEITVNYIIYQLRKVPYLGKLSYIQNLEYKKEKSEMNVTRDYNNDLKKLENIPGIIDVAGMSLFNDEIRNRIYNDPDSIIQLLAILTVLSEIIKQNNNLKIGNPENIGWKTWYKGLNLDDVSKNFIKNVIENNENVEDVSDAILKAFCMGVLVILYPDDVDDFFDLKNNFTYDNLSRDKKDKFNELYGFFAEVINQRISKAKFSDNLLKGAVANANFEFISPKNRDDSSLLPNSQTILRLLANIAHEIAHFKLEVVDKDYHNGFLPEFYSEVNSVIFILECMNLCENDSDKKIFEEYLPFLDSSHLFSSEHNTARAFNQMFYNVCGTDIAKWKAFQEIISNTIRDGVGKYKNIIISTDADGAKHGEEMLFPIEYIKRVIGNFSSYTDENGKKIFTEKDIAQIKKELEQSWQYPIYEMLRSDKKLKEIIDIEKNEGEIKISIEERNKSPYKKEWLYYGYEYLGSAEPNKELLKRVWRYKLVKLKNDFNKALEINKPEITEKYTKEYQRQVSGKERLYVEQWGDYYDIAMENGVDAKEYLDFALYLKIIGIKYLDRNKDDIISKTKELENIIKNKEIDVKHRLLALAYLNGFQLQGMPISEEIIEEIRNDFINAIRNGEMTLDRSNNFDLRAIATGIYLIMENEFSKNLDSNEKEKLNDYRNKIFVKISNAVLLEENPIVRADDDLNIAESNLDSIIKTLAHELAHNMGFAFIDRKVIFDDNSITKFDNKFLYHTGSELFAEINSAMVCQILNKEFKTTDCLYKIYTDKTENEYDKFIALNEYRVAEGLIHLLKLAFKDTEYDVNYGIFAKSIIDVFQKMIQNDDSNENYQATFLRKILDTYLDNIKGEYPEEVFSKIENIIREEDSWKKVVSDIFDILRENEPEQYTQIITAIVRDENIKISQSSYMVETGLENLDLEKDNQVIPSMVLSRPENTKKVLKIIEDIINKKEQKNQTENDILALISTIKAIDMNKSDSFISKQQVYEESGLTLNAEEQINEFFQDEFVNKIYLNKDIANYKFKQEDDSYVGGKTTKEYQIPDTNANNLDESRGAYRKHVEEKEKEFIDEYNFDDLYKYAKEHNIDAKKLKILNYFRIIKNSENNNYLKNVIENEYENIEIRLLAYGYYMNNDGDSSRIEKENLITEAKKMIKNYNEKKIENYLYLRAVCVGVTLILLNETDAESNLFIELDKEQTKKLYWKVLTSNISNRKGGNFLAWSDMLFGEMSISTISHEIGHNIFHIKHGIGWYCTEHDYGLQYKTLEELSAYTCSDMFMQIIYGSDYDPTSNSFLPLYNKEKGPFEKEHASAKGLLNVIYIASKEFGIEMSYGNFFKMLLENKEKDNNIIKKTVSVLSGSERAENLTIGSQGEFLKELINCYFSWLLLNGSDEEIKKLKSIYLWKNFITDIFEYLVDNNENLCWSLFGTAGFFDDDDRRFKKAQKNKYLNLFEYINNFLKEKITKYSDISNKKVVSADAISVDSYMPTLTVPYSEEDKERDSKDAYKELAEIILNIYLLSQPYNFVFVGDFIERNINTLSKDQMKVIENITGITFELEPKYDFSSMKRVNLSYDQRNNVIEMIENSSIENKEEILEKLKKEQEFVIKLKVANEIIPRTVLDKDTLLKRIGNINNVIDSVFLEISKTETISEEQLNKLIKDTIDKMPSSALLPENQRDVYEWMKEKWMEKNGIKKSDSEIEQKWLKEKNFKLSFIEKLKKSVEMAWNEFSPSLYSSFSKRHFEKDSSTAKKLQNVTKIGAVISAITAGIAMFWLNPVGTSAVVVRLAIWSFFVVGITSVLTFLTNMITHTYIIYRFMGAVEKSDETEREKLEKIIYKTDGLATIDLSNEEFSMSDEQNRKELRNTIEDFVKKCDNEGKKGKIIINEAQKQALGHYQIGINTSYLAEKNIYMYVKQKDGEEILISKTKPEDSTAILPKTEQYVNKSVSAGKSPLRISLGVALKEFLKVYNVISFYDAHETTKARGTALILSTISYLVPAIVGVLGILMPAIPIIALIGIFIISIPITNVGTHVILDFKAIETRKELFDDIMIDFELKAIQTQSNNEAVIPVYIMSKDLTRLGYENPINTGLKTAKGESVFMVKTNEAIVFGTRSGAGAKEIAQVLNESKVLNDLVNSLLRADLSAWQSIKNKIYSFFQSSKLPTIQSSKMDIIVEDKQYVEENKEQFEGSNVIFEDGITIVKEIKSTNSEDIKKEFEELSAVKQTVFETAANKIITSLEPTTEIKTEEQLEKELINGKARKVITKEQYEQLKVYYDKQGKNISEELNKLAENGIEIIVRVENEYDETEVKKEYMPNGVSGVITKEGQLFDFYTGDKTDVMQDIMQQKEINMNELQKLLISSEKPILVGIDQLRKIFKGNQSMDTYSMFETLIGNLKLNFGIGELKEKDVENMAYNVSFGKIPTEWENLSDNDEIMIIYESIKDDTNKQKFKAIIEERIEGKKILKNIVPADTLESIEQNKEFKKLEKILVKNIKGINVDNVINKRSNFIDVSKSLNQNKINLYERLTLEEQQEDIVAIVISIMDLIADDNKQTDNIDKEKDDVRGYRAMLCAA